MTTLARPLSAGRRLEVCSRNVAIYITLDYIVRQRENLAFIFKTVVHQRESKFPALKVTSHLQRPKKNRFSLLPIRKRFEIFKGTRFI